MAFVLLFYTGLASRSGYQTAAFIVALLGCLILIVLAASDKVVIERRRLVARGIVQSFLSLFTGRGLRLKFVDIERIETYAVQRFRRGGSVFYSYRTVVRGGSAKFIIRSRSSSFHQFVATVFGYVADDVMDNHSLELRDYFADRHEVRERARSSEIPRGDVLEGVLRKVRRQTLRKRSEVVASTAELGRAKVLRRLANEMRVAGFLVQSLEAFRRAAIIQPNNGWLLFEFGRCILSYAASERDGDAERRGLAMLRLAEQRAIGDKELLSRLGESYFYAGDIRRAEITFRKVTETVGATFRSVCGQAEIALRQGKFAHVVHNFSIANKLSAVPSLKKWTHKEINYFTKLSGDGEYMELEISRLGLVEKLYKLVDSAIPVTAAGLILLMTGVLLQDGFISDIGWAISGIALAVWVAARIGAGIFASRMPLEPIDK